MGLIGSDVSTSITNKPTNTKLNIDLLNNFKERCIKSGIHFYLYFILFSVLHLCKKFAQWKDAKWRRAFFRFASTLSELIYFNSVLHSLNGKLDNCRLFIAYKGCQCNFTWLSLHRWQCSIHNGTYKCWFTTVPINADSQRYLYMLIHNGTYKCCVWSSMNYRYQCL